MNALLDQARQVACHGDSASLGSLAPEILSANLPVLNDRICLNFLGCDLSVRVHHFLHSAVEPVELRLGHVLQIVEAFLQAISRWAHAPNGLFKAVDVRCGKPDKLTCAIWGEGFVLDVIQYGCDLGVVQPVASGHRNQHRNGCPQLLAQVGNGVVLDVRTGFAEGVDGRGFVLLELGAGFFDGASERRKIDPQDFCEKLVAVGDDAVIVDETLDAVAAKGAKGVALMAYGLENWAVASAGDTSHRDPAAAAVSLRIDIVDGGIDLIQLNDARLVRGQHVAVVFLNRGLKRRAGDRLRRGCGRRGGIVQAVQNSSQKRHLKTSFGQLFKPLEIAKGLGIRATRKDAV